MVTIKEDCNNAFAIGSPINKMIPIRKGVWLRYKYNHILKKCEISMFEYER